MKREVKIKDNRDLKTHKVEAEELRDDNISLKMRRGKETEE